MAENAEIESKLEGLQYKHNVTPVRQSQPVEVEMVSREHNTTVAGGSLSTNSTHIRITALHNYALTIAGSEENIPIAEDVTRVSTEESTWKKKYEMLLSRLDEEAGSTAQDTQDTTAQQAVEEPSVVGLRKRRKRMAIFGVAMCFVIFGSVLAMGVLLTNDGNLPEGDRAAEIISFLNNATFTGRDLQYNVNSTHPSDMALVWVIGVDPLKLTVAKDREHLLQRFALMTFILGQKGQNDKETLVGSDYLHECKHFSVFNKLWECDSEDGLITEITASGAGLYGLLPADVALFPGLVHMNFRDNSWTGPIPSSIGTMTQLKSLGLANNKFTGTIPSSLSLLAGLTTMDLDSNQLTGTIPNSIGDMINLRSLQLSNNNFNGTVPPTLGNLTRLSRLWLQGNRLSGTLPIELAQHQPANVLLYRNEITGVMPYCAVNSTQRTALAADCDRVECSCCSNCCPRSVGNIPVYFSCAP